MECFGKQDDDDDDTECKEEEQGCSGNGGDCYDDFGDNIVIAVVVFGSDAM